MHFFTHCEMWISERWLFVGVFVSVVATVSTYDFLKEFVIKFRNNNTSPCDDFYRHVCPYNIANGDTMGNISDALMREWSDPGWEWMKMRKDAFEQNYVIRKIPKKIRSIFSPGTDNSKRVKKLRKNLKIIKELPYRAALVYSLNQREEKHPLHGYDFGQLEKMYEELYEMLKEEINYPGNPEYGTSVQSVWNETFPKLEHIFGLSQETMEDAKLYLDVYFQIQILYNNFLSVSDRQPFTKTDVESRLEELMILHDTFLLPVLEKIPQLKRFAVRSTFSLEAFNSASKILLSETMLAPILQPDVPLSVLLGYIGTVTAHELYHSLILETVHMELSSEIRERGDCQVEHYEKSCRIWREGECYSGASTMDEDAADIEGIQLALKLLKKRLGKKMKEPVYSDLPITHEQMFFYSSTVPSCDTYRISQHILGDEHSADRLRHNAVFSMMKTFQEAFQCQEGDRMVQRSQCNYFGSDVRR